MAQMLSVEEARNFKAGEKTVDLIALIGVGKPAGAKVVGPYDVELGDIVWTYAMGNIRRGVVVKVTKTKVHTAVTTQGAVDATVRTAGRHGVRVQICIEEEVHVGFRHAEIEEAHAEALIEDAERTAAILDDAHAEALIDDAEAEIEAQLTSTKVTIEGETEASQSPRKLPETTGSAVVRLLERVYSRIRSEHPELPEMVIVTGAGIGNGNSKWGHFRPEGWAAGEGRMHEMFMAGETLAKGSRQVLQTMLHESAHTLAQVRGVKDTSRQGRWHNATFRKLAEEMGLEHRGSQADKTHGFSFVTLPESTADRYADLLAELDAEIHLTVKLPVWLGGDADEPQGGEQIGKAPKTGESKQTGGKRAVCGCLEPNIIRLSQKVLDLGVVRCDSCDNLFTAS